LVKAVKLKLQKVVGSFASGVRLNLARGWIKLKKVLLHVLSYFQYCCHVTTPVTVIRSTKNRYNILILFFNISNKENTINNNKKQEQTYDLLYQVNNQLVLNICIAYLLF
jgi:hypothetical protein